MKCLSRSSQVHRKQTLFVLLVGAILTTLVGVPLTAFGQGGAKTFINETAMDLAITLLIPDGEEPANFAGALILPLLAGETKIQSYGTDTNSPLLNRIHIAIVSKGSVCAQEQLVTILG